MRHSSFLFFRRFTNIHSVRRRLAVGFDDRGNGIMMFKNSKGVEVDLVNYGSYGVYFSAYNENGFVLSSGVKIIGPCAAFPRNALCWHVNNALDITEKSLSLFFMLEPPIEVLIIGKGETKSMVDYRRILDICWKHRLCVEVMPTHSAIGTFNYLNSEGRYVAAALIPPRRLDDYEDADRKATKLLIARENENTEELLLPKDNDDNNTMSKLLTSGEYKDVMVTRSPLAVDSNTSSTSSSSSDLSKSSSSSSPEGDSKEKK
ncbi:unnamed protein product [Trichobilharzia szidati]|nr:unnamed protein product [Trichobilharzia szidati]